jgi:choice-of-anchor B domain-containing protein
VIRPLLVATAVLSVAAGAHAASINAPIGQGAPDDGPGVALGATPCVGGFAGVYPCNNVDLMAFLPVATIGGGSGSDIWGWTDPVTGKEWAILGRSNGTSFVDISDPANPIYVANLVSHVGSSSWREIKTHGNHVYIVADVINGHGMQIFDLTRLRTITSPPVTFTAAQADGHYSGFGRCHDVAVDTASGFLYCVGTDTFSGGLHILDLANPTNPTFVGSFAANGYIHDTQCVVYHGPDVAHQGKQICFASNSTTSGGSGPDRLAIVDVTNKSAPVVIAQPTYAGSAFIHQGWLTEDHRYFLVDDELDEQGFGHNTKTYMWDLTDLDAPVLIGFHLGPTTAIDHNQFIKGHYSYQANYTAGLRILDVANVAAGTLTEVAAFDIVPAHNNATFNGSWGVFPFFASGTVIVSGISGAQTGGLFVLRPRLDADFAVGVAPSTVGVCGTGSAPATVSVTPANGYTGTVTFGATGLPAGASAAFVPPSAAVPASSTMTLTATAVAAGTYPFTVTATDGTLTRSASATLAVSTTTPPAPALAAPANLAQGQPQRPSFSWGTVTGAVGYDLQIATTSVFAAGDVVQQASGITTTTHTATADLQTNTTYYWRVRTTSACGTGGWSAPFRFTTAAPAAGCPLGSSAAVAWSESFETGAAGWTHSGSGDTWAASGARTHDGALAFRAAGSASVSDQRLVTPPIAVPAGQTPVTLQFWNWQELEAEVPASSLTIGCRDGALLEVSTNDGASWLPVATLLTDPYDGLVSSGTGNPLAGSSAWCGDPQDWVNSVVDLAPWAGQTVRFRFRVGTNSSVAREGWYLDELKVQGCVGDPTPTLSINDVTSEEADAHDAHILVPDHSPLLTLAVTLSAPSAQTVTVNWATADGTATAGLDYTAGAGTLTFLPGATVQPIDVTMLPDTLAEPAETILIDLSAPVAATLADAQGIATILDNDTVPTVSIGDASVAEGDTGTRELVFTLTQSQPIAQTTAVGFMTEDETAVSPSDYTAASGTVTFPGGTTSRTITVLVNGDPTNEVDEEMHIHLLAPLNATLGNDHAIGTLVDDDEGPGQELAHGSNEVHSLAALPGGVANPTLFRLAQQPNASYEITVDAAAGDVQPIVLERLAVDGTTVLQTGVATGLGRAVALRWQNIGAAQATQWIRVRSGGCTASCGPAATYRIRAYETTLSLARWSATPQQATIVILQNRGTRPISGRVQFWHPIGVPGLGAALFTLAPGANTAFNILDQTPGSIVGFSGAATVIHDGGYDELVGKAVAIEPGTGFTFDTPLLPRPR